MTKRPIILLLLVFATASLTACAPNTDEAYTKCVKATLLGYDESSMNANDYIFVMTEVAQDCQDAAEADPSGFNEKWL